MDNIKQHKPKYMRSLSENMPDGHFFTSEGTPIRKMKTMMQGNDGYRRQKTAHDAL